MIFVGLAIITLIISFIIALISLIREQKQEAGIEEPQALIKDEVELKPKEELKENQIEPFPWEQAQPINSSLQKDHNQLSDFSTQNQLSGTIFLKDAGAKDED